jgi:hypothetical protein
MRVYELSGWKRRDSFVVAFLDNDFWLLPQVGGASATLLLRLCTRTRRGWDRRRSSSPLNTSSSKSGEMVWAFTPPPNASWLQLLEPLIYLAIIGFAAYLFPDWVLLAASRGIANHFLTLKIKARVLKIRALRALDSAIDSAMDSCPRLPADCAVSRVAALPEFWALVAEHSGVVGAWRLTGLCTAAREGAKGWLRALPGLVVCGGYVGGEGDTSAVWRLDLGELRWERMSDLGGARSDHACCAVRGGVVVLGGQAFDDEVKVLSTVEVSRSDSQTEEHTFTDLPPLSCGPRSHSIALPIDEIESAQGQVLLLGGYGEGYARLDLASRVLKVDLATGACTPHPPLLYDRVRFAAARLPDGRVVCAGGRHPAGMTAEVLEPPEQESPDDAVWRWRELPHMSVHRFGAAGCVLSDGRFAVFGGEDGQDVVTASCEVLTLDGDERWELLPPMREARRHFLCAAMGGCVIVAGGGTSIFGGSEWRCTRKRWDGGGDFLATFPTTVVCGWGAR